MLQKSKRRGNIQEEMMDKHKNSKRYVSEKYLNLRKNALDYSSEDMNLKLQNSDQVYIAVFDIPIESILDGFHTQTLVMLFGLNTHLYHGNGQVIVDLEKYVNVMKAMQSLFISCSQVLKYMQLTSDIDFYESKNIRAYLKTSEGIYFKELDMGCKEDRFLNMLLENVLKEIAKVL